MEKVMGLLVVFIEQIINLGYMTQVITSGFHGKNHGLLAHKLVNDG